MERTRTRFSFAAFVAAAAAMAGVAATPAGPPEEVERRSRRRVNTGWVGGFGTPLVEGLGGRSRRAMGHGGGTPSRRSARLRGMSRGRRRAAKRRNRGRA